MKLTRELIEKIAKTLASGCYADTAARVHGVSKASYHSWLQKGHEQRRGIYRDFLDAVEEALAKADALDHARITAAAPRDWKAAAAHLALRNPARYAVKRTELSGPEGKPIGLAVAPSTEASLLALFKKLEEGGGE